MNSLRAYLQLGRILPREVESMLVFTGLSGGDV